MRTLVAILILAIAAPAWAAFDDDGKEDLSALRTQIEAGDAKGALTVLEAAARNDPGDADVHNLLGYANRKLKRYALARTHYDKALELDAKHRGALEYMGELELETGQPGAARELLSRLRAACPDGCHELEDLIQAFEEHGIAMGEGS